MKQISDVGPRRMVLVALGLAFGGAGAARLAGPGAAMWLGVILLPVVVPMCVVALATAALDSWGWNVAVLLALPLMAAAYASGDGGSTRDPMGWALLAVASALLAMSLRDVSRKRAPRVPPMKVTPW